MSDLTGICTFILFRPIPIVYTLDSRTLTTWARACYDDDADDADDDVWWCDPSVNAPGYLLCRPRTRVSAISHQGDKGLHTEQWDGIDQIVLRKKGRIVIDSLAYSAYTEARPWRTWHMHTFRQRCPRPCVSVSCVQRPDTTHPSTHKNTTCLSQNADQHCCDEV